MVSINMTSLTCAVAGLAVGLASCSALAQESPTSEDSTVFNESEMQEVIAVPAAEAPEETEEPREPEAPILTEEEADAINDEQFEDVLNSIQPALASPPEESLLFYDAAYLQGMNKVTARVSPVEAPIGSAVRFGNLEIISRACWKSPPEERPESAALLEIWNMKPGESPERIFLGWMFASSPGLSALEHPVYDITVLDCRKKSMLPEQ